MPLINYTTEVPVQRSLAEIMAMLQTGGATAIMLLNNAAGEVDAVHFRMKVAPFGEVTYSLPANVAAVSQTINRMIQKRERTKGGNLKIPLSALNDKAMAQRVAWRIVRDWLEVQLAIHDLGAASIAQTMLPFAVDHTGDTLFARLLARGSLSLPPAS